MKFGKVLQHHAEHFPDKPFLSYKQLKKLLKTQASNSDHGGVGDQERTQAVTPCPQHRVEFISVLNDELRELNGYFMGEEEDLVIRHGNLTAPPEPADEDEKLEFKAELVEFYGDVVNLKHWVVLNYAAFEKILKKHDKLLDCCGMPLRESLLESVLHQPFNSTEVLERLLRQCKIMIDEWMAADKVDRKAIRDLDLKDLKIDAILASHESILYALRTWRDLGNNAHTPSTILPYSKPIPDSVWEICLRNDDEKEEEEGSDSESVDAKKRPMKEDDDEEVDRARKKKIARRSE